MRTIVVPTDCSPLSREALRYADRIAAHTNATVIAVYGTAFSGRMEGEGVCTSLDRESMIVPIRNCMEDTIRQSLAPETQRDIVICDCQPADAIISIANQRDADLIIMGTHDRNRVTRAILGSVTDAVLHHTHRPVLILREHSNVGERPIARILCPYRKNRPASEAAVREAKKLADVLGAELTLLEVVDQHDIANKVIAQCEEKHADLIVIGTEHRRFSDPSELGRPASQIVRTAHCPVLSVCG